MAASKTHFALIVALNVPICSDPLLFDRHPHAWARTFGLLEAAAFSIGYEWLLRIRRTELGGGARGSRGERLFRVAQSLAVFHGVVGFVAPDLRLAFWDQLERGDGLLQVLAQPGIFLATVPIYLSIAPAAVSIFELARSKPDSAEIVRLNAIGIAGPFLFSGMFVPGSWMPITSGIAST